MRRNVSVALLVAALLPLAGCLDGDDGTDDRPDEDLAVASGDFYSDVPYDPSLLDLEILSQPAFDILPVEEVWIPMADGKRIHNAVYRPDTAEPVPVWINFSPYWGDTALEGGDAFSQYLIDNFVPRGYAVVLSALRGTGHSEGCFQIGGDLELQDSYDVIDFFADEDWSNGAIGAGGKSYDSTTQNGVIAKYPHPALKTVFHVSGITDMYRYNYRYGYPTSQGTVFNTYYYAQGTDEYGASLVGAGGAADEDPESLARLLDDVACPQLPEIQAHGIASGLTGMKTDYWIERDWTRYIGGSDWQGSIFFYHGFQDWNVKPDNILPWLENVPKTIPVKVWLHQNEYNLGHVYPMRTDWNLTLLRWTDHFLKGIDTGILDEPLVELEGSDGVWRTEDAYPPTRAEWTDVPLADARAGGSGPFVTQEVVVAEATDASGPLRYSGAPRLTVTATSTSPDPALVAVLYDEAPDGTRAWTNEAVLRGIYRDSLESPAPVTPGTPTEYTLESYPQDDVLLPGHRWVLVLGDAPRESTNTGALVDPGGQPLAGQAGTTYDLSEAFLSLPLVPMDQERSLQPTAMECITC